MSLREQSLSASPMGRFLAYFFCTSKRNRACGAFGSALWKMTANGRLIADLRILSVVPAGTPSGRFGTDISVPYEHYRWCCPWERRPGVSGGPGHSPAGERA